ncbi:MAG: lysylphosphatidylglycerol synthase domain-containing protein [Acidimicrobiales bacterium]
MDSRTPRVNGTSPPARVRRPLDLLLALAALVALALLVTAVHGLPAGGREVSGDVTKAAGAIPHALTVAGAFLALVAALLLALLALNTLLRRAPQAALDAAVAAVLAAAASLLASLIWNNQHGELGGLVLNGANPTGLVYACAFVAFLVGSDLVRRGRWTRWCALGAVALFIFSVASRSLAPLAAPLALAEGLFFGWAVRWALGTVATRPSTDELAAGLRPEVSVVQLREVAGSRSRLEGELSDGTSIEVRIADRDTRGSGIARRVWSLVRLRSVLAGHPVLSSRARLERVSLASLLADPRGVVVPKVLVLRELQNDTLVLVTTRPAGRHPSKGESPEDVATMFTALRLLHDAGLAHRDLRPQNLVLGSGSAGFSSLDKVQPGAGDLARRLDVAQLLTTAAQCSSPAVAVRALRDAYEPADEVAIGSVLQPIALAPWGWSEMRAARDCVAEMRKELVGSNVEPVEPALERFRWRTVVTTTAVIAAAFIFVGQLSKVNLAGALGHANLAWCAAALAASALGNVAAAENLIAFVPKRLPLLRSAAVQLATAFVGVAMPPTVGHVAVNSRYLHREGVEEGSIAAAVALSQIVNVVTTVLLLLIIGLLTGSRVSELKLAPSDDLLIALGAAFALVAVLLSIPRTRSLITRNVWPRLRTVWPRLLQALSSPVRLGIGGGCNLLLSACYVVAFVAAIEAVGGHPAILPVAAVFLAGNAVGSAAPTPGGVGAIEAVLSAGLSALGIPLHQAVPAVLIFRLATFWLPIPAGWLSYTVLQRKGIL